MTTLTGKCLVRRSDKRIIICGVFNPDFDVSDIIPPMGRCANLVRVE